MTTTNKVHLPEIPNNIDKDLRISLNAIRDKIKSGTSGTVGPAGPAGPAGPTGPAGGAVGSGSMASSIAATPATLNLSTQGTKDWYTMAGTQPNPPRAQSGTTVHSKVLGGWIKDSFDWFSGGAAVPSIVAGGSGGVTMTTSSTDDMSSSLSASTPNSTAIRNATGTPLSFGYRFEVPADINSRTLKLCFAVNSVKVTVTCRMSDGSVADFAAATLDAVTSGTYIQKELTVTYNAGSPNAKMIVTVSVTANYGGSFQDVVYISATVA